MIRRFVRSLGFLLVAIGFVAFVIDGARFLADGVFPATKLGQIAFEVLRERFLLLQPAVERHVHPALWQFGLQPLLETPAFIVLIVFGFALLWLARRKQPPIGHETGGV
jgi:hypothetical protein